MIERGSYRVKGASGVFMRERVGRGFVGSRSKAPVGVLGDEVPQKLPQKLKILFMSA